MRRRLAALALVALLPLGPGPACAGSADPEGFESCDERFPRRPEVCTQEYVPVCGQREDGTRKTYGNKCDACADQAVRGFVTGACPESDAPR